jgi:putative transposase
LHFISCSCYQRQPWLASARRRDLFLAGLEQVGQRYGVVVLGYVVMPEHFHLLISEPQRGTPSVVMQAVKLGCRRAMQQPRRWEDAAPSHVWQRRFYDFHVRTERKRIEKLRYMHQNPVKRALVAAPDQWGWSSVLRLRRSWSRDDQQLQPAQNDNSRGLRCRKFVPPSRPHFSPTPREMGHPRRV